MMKKKVLKLYVDTNEINSYEKYFDSMLTASNYNHSHNTRTILDTSFCYIIHQQSRTLDGYV